ncbi:MAG: symmetrical bis(5'-nucleosyl)-tetraphosphatase [Gammaproteobacteria bacterium]|nr:symmetrical bis(5'-nucleosyl)-tetraphosphatase [Gammaproteobacteria bacterium]
MSTYAIGDLQGCYDELQCLLDKIKFDPAQDTLWFTGDLVNRGSKSLECLRFVKRLGTNAITVLGNHDLHLLAVAYANRRISEGDTLDEILQAPDRDELLTWLRQQPLLHDDPHLNFVLVHAGIAPQWDLSTAQNLAHEVEAQLQTTDSELLEQIYGNEPACWDDSLTGVARWRCIINYFTRMRFCTKDGCLDLNYKGELAGAPADMLPWFKMPARKTQQNRIIFGHWAALQGKADAPNVFALDTGCVWGESLTALRLEDLQKFSVPATSKNPQ